MGRRTDWRRFRLLLLNALLLPVMPTMAIPGRDAAGDDEDEDDREGRPDVGAPEYLRWKANREGFESHSDYVADQDRKAEERREEQRQERGIPDNPAPGGAMTDPGDASGQVDEPSQRELDRMGEPAADPIRVDSGEMPEQLERFRRENPDPSTLRGRLADADEPTEIERDPMGPAAAAPIETDPGVLRERLELVEPENPAPPPAGDPMSGDRDRSNAPEVAVVQDGGDAVEHVIPGPEASGGGATDPRPPDEAPPPPTGPTQADFHEALEEVGAIRRAILAERNPNVLVPEGSLDIQSPKWDAFWQAMVDSGQVSAADVEVYKRALRTTTNIDGEVSLAALTDPKTEVHQTRMATTGMTSYTNLADAVTGLPQGERVRQARVNPDGTFQIDSPLIYRNTTEFVDSPYGRIRRDIAVDYEPGDEHRATWAITYTYPDGRTVVTNPRPPYVDGFGNTHQPTEGPLPQPAAHPGQQPAGDDAAALAEWAQRRVDFNTYLRATRDHSEIPRSAYVGEYGRAYEGNLSVGMRTRIGDVLGSDRANEYGLERDRSGNDWWARTAGSGSLDLRPDEVEKLARDEPEVLEHLLDFELRDALGTVERAEFEAQNAVVYPSRPAPPPAAEPAPTGTGDPAGESPPEGQGTPTEPAGQTTEEPQTAWHWTDPESPFNQQQEPEPAATEDSAGAAPPEGQGTATGPKASAGYENPAQDNLGPLESTPSVYELVQADNREAFGQRLEPELETEAAADPVFLEAEERLNLRKRRPDFPWLDEPDASTLRQDLRQDTAGPRPVLNEGQQRRERPPAPKVKPLYDPASRSGRKTTGRKVAGRGRGPARISRRVRL